MLGDYKYEKLMKYFQTINENKVTLNYSYIEGIIGFKLPKSAYQYSAYWSESKTHTITRSWIENGWKISELKLGKYIEFTREVAGLRD